MIESSTLSRPASRADAAHLADLFNASLLALTGEKEDSEHSLLEHFDAHAINLAENTRLLTGADGRFLAYAELRDPYETHVRVAGNGVVHPEQAGRGLEAALTAWMVERARQMTLFAQEGARVVLHFRCDERETAWRAALDEAGFTPVRLYCRMRIEMDAPPAAAAFPPGITVRPIRPGEEDLVLRPLHEAFQDHWGFAVESYDAYRRRMSLRLAAAQTSGPEMWFTALDGDEPAGAVLCNLSNTGHSGEGWIDLLGVRRAWRRIGLGGALLLHAFGYLYGRGCRSAGLSVDSNNLTGAMGLYENAGMRPVQRLITHELELKPGFDLLNRG